MQTEDHQNGGESDKNNVRNQIEMKADKILGPQRSTTVVFSTHRGDPKEAQGCF